MRSRSVNPVKPDPFPGCTPPEPLSATAIRNPSASLRSQTVAWVAPECRDTLASSSATQKYASVSTPSDGRTAMSSTNQAHRHHDADQHGVPDGPGASHRRRRSVRSRW
jgi:hypothetical protein